MVPAVQGHSHTPRLNRSCRLVVTSSPYAMPCAGPWAYTTPLAFTPVTQQQQVLLPLSMESPYRFRFPSIPYISVWPKSSPPHSTRKFRVLLPNEQDAWLRSLSLGIGHHSCDAHTFGSGDRTIPLPYSTPYIPPTFNMSPISRFQ